MASTTSFDRSPAGTDRLLRRWPAASPVASLLLVHGLHEHSGRYERVGDLLAARDIDVLAYDLPGHGRSGGRRAHIEHFDDLFADVEDLLTERRTAGLPVVLFGHSLGGLIAVAYAESDRPQPDLLAVSAPALVSTTPGALRAAAAVFSRVAPKLAVPSALRPDHLSRDEAVARAYTEDPLRLSKTTARMGQEVLDAQAPARAGLDRIRVPVWVVHGGDDRIVPVEASAGFEGRPATTRRVHAGLRHESLNEPEGPAIVDDLVGWIRDQVSAG
jgi:acylglycerol lipase